MAQECATCPPEQPESTSTLTRAAEPAPAFVSPPLAPGERPAVALEFCDRCRWFHRASWTVTELALTFPTPRTAEDAKGIRSFTLLPRVDDETAGRFRVWLWPEEGEATCVYDRKTEGGFPELKVLKQRIRDIISPKQGLGHSDKQPA